MSGAIVVTGTDTDVGKTVFSAALAQAIGAFYWKPIQAGLEVGGDSRQISRLTDLCGGRLISEAYRLNSPLSPHRAAELDGVEIDLAKLQPPAVRPLVIEGAGGALVPVTRSCVYADLFAAWSLPTIIVARTALGTINHSLLTIEALRSRHVPILGSSFVREANNDSEATICQMGRVKRLGTLPHLDPLDRSSLAGAFRSNFNRSDFT